MEALKYAQDLIKVSNSYVSAGFNTFINGGEEPNNQDYGDKQEWHVRSQGYDYAKKMAEENGISFIKPFKCGKSKSCYPFEFGGFFVCNSCGNKGVDKDWWKIKVEKDGNEFCCHGIDFENLQESNNYAFGKSFLESIDNYGKVMMSYQNGT